MLFTERYNPYIDKWGLVQPEPKTTSDNGIRFSVESILAAHVQHSRGYPDSAELSFFIKQRVLAIKYCESRGLLYRYPNCLTQEGWDDYYAASCMGYFHDKPFALKLYKTGLDNCGVFRNDPNASIFAKHNNPLLWRGGALRPHMKHCAGFQLNIFDQLQICLGLKLSSMSKEQDAKMLMFFVVSAIKGKYSLVDSSIAEWSKKLKEHFPRGIGNVLAQYFHPEHCNHPNSEYLMDFFG
jgi:hypothetical protein